jgi:deoxyadenosine/deoxycytidine kinase
MKEKIVALVGIPASGKTTLGKNLHKKFSIEFLEENWKSIPFMAGRLAEKASKFEICIGFLNMRYSQIIKAKKIKLNGNSVVIDTVFEMTEIYSRQILNDEEYSEFKKVYDVYKNALPEPDLYIYLTGNVEMIRERALKRNLGIKIENEMLSMENLLNAKKGIEVILDRLDAGKVLEIDVVNEDIRIDDVLDLIAKKAELQ